MMTSNPALLLAIPILLSTSAAAKIQIENKSGWPLRVSLHGDYCKQFDGDRYDYAPCDEKFLQGNACAIFENGNESFSQKSRVVFPRIIFNWYGFSYNCRLDQVSLDGLDDSSSAKAPVLIKLGSLGLSTQVDYGLTIQPGFGYFPQPYVDCEIRKMETHKACGE